MELIKKKLHTEESSISHIFVSIRLTILKLIKWGLKNINQKAVFD